MNKKDMKKIKPLKKKHTGLKIFLIIVCVILVLPIAFVFIAFFDTTTKKVSDKEVTYQNLVSQVFYKGLQNIDPTNPELKFTINEEMIDGIMMAACDSINQKQWIPKMYCYVNDNNYTFVMDAQASFFKTRALIHTSLDKEDSTLVFKITGVTLGRLPLPLNWITGLLGNFLNDDVLNSAFEKSGFHIQSHLAEAKLTYSREQFRIDVGNYLSNMGNDNAFLNVLLSTFDNDEVLTTDYKDGVSVGLNLSKLMIDKNAKKAPLEFNDLDKHKKEVAHLLNNGLEEKDAPKVFKYLMRGSDSIDELKDLDNAQKKAIETYVSATFPDETLDNYKGNSVTVTSETSDATRFADYCKNQLGVADVFGYSITPPIFATFKLPTNSLNQVLAAKLNSVIGMTVPITFKEEDQWYFEYITVDNVYTGISGDTTSGFNFDIYLRLNISGSPVTLVISTNKIGFEVGGEGELGHLKFELKDIHFGSIKIEDKELIDSVVNLIPNDGTVFKYNSSKGQFEVSIDELADLGEGLPLDEIKNLIIQAGDPALGRPSEDTDGDTLELMYS